MKLSISNLSVRYGNVSALRDLSFDMNEGDFITLIGSNGAGKSTTLRTLSGLTKPVAGTIEMDGMRIDQLGADKILRMGLAHVPEGRRVFKDLSVLENLYLGAYIQDDKKQIEADLQLQFQRFPRLLERKNQQARTLSGGEQQMLSISRALMSRPDILLLDEPSLGLAPIIVQEIGEILLDINRQGVSIVLVEQNADMALRLANYAYVLETGSVALQGKGSELADNEHVKSAYLGI